MADVRLNVQGLARRDKSLMSCIMADKGYTSVSIDLSAGEPTVTSHFSQDVNYKYACFDGVGKAPEYRGPTLMIDDIYLMTMSRSPVGRELMRDTFATKFGGMSFAQQWVEDSDVIKDQLKPARNLHKMLALALGYGMGPKKMVKQAYDKGHELAMADAKIFYKEYWDLFNGVRLFAKKLERQIQRKGWMVNPFGYRLVPESHKAFNYYIQSTVSGIMHLYRYYLMELSGDYAIFITCIHDELLMDVPDDKIELFRKHCQEATDKLNQNLKWTVAVRTGFVTGKTWYEAK